MPPRMPPQVSTRMTPGEKVRFRLRRVTGPQTARKRALSPMRMATRPRVMAGPESLSTKSSRPMSRKRTALRISSMSSQNLSR